MYICIRHMYSVGSKMRPLHCMPEILPTKMKFISMESLKENIAYCEVNRLINFCLDFFLYLRFLMWNIGVQCSGLPSQNYDLVKKIRLSKQNILSGKEISCQLKLLVLLCSAAFCTESKIMRSSLISVQVSIFIKMEKN